MVCFGIVQRLSILVVMVCVLHVHINAQEVPPKELSYSERYVRSHTPTKAMMYAFDVNSSELLPWILTHRASEFASSSLAKLLEESPIDSKNLWSKMWQGKSRYDRLALACHRIAFQDPFLHQRFWHIMHESHRCYKGKKGLNNFFPLVNAHLRNIFLRAMIAPIMISDGALMCEQQSKDFAWYISHKMAVGLTPQHLIELCRCAIKLRPSVESVRFNHLHSRKKRRLAQCADDLITEIVTDEDRYFENILMRGTTNKQRKALEDHLKAGMEEGEIHPDKEWIGSALEYAERQKKIGAIVYKYYQEQGLGSDLFKLQQEFIYP